MLLPSCQVLSAEQVRRVHAKSVELLEEVGFSVPHDRALAILAQKGATVDFKSQRVRFSPDLTEKTLETVPRAFTCAGRDPAFDFTVGPEAPPVCRSTGGAVNLLDFTSQASRPLTIQDCRELAQLIDGLEHTAIAAAQTPCDVPLPVYDIHVLKAMLESGRKHLWSLVTSSANLAYQIEMMLAVAGSAEALQKRPVCQGIVTVLEQFRFPHDEIERLLLYGRYCIPVKVPVVPMMGTVAPITILGTLVQANAEAIGSAVLIELLCPGTPTWYYFFVQAMDKKSGGSIFMSPEIMLCSLGLIQMARHYRLPAAPSSFETNGSRLTDILFNNGSAVTLFALAGASEHASTGCVDMSMGISKQGLVIGDDIWGQTKRLLAGFQSEEAAYATEAIKRVALGSGEFLTDEHTGQFVRRESQYIPRVLSYQGHQAWAQNPKHLAEEAQERVADLLDNHEVPPLETGLQQELHRITAAAEKAAGCR